MHIQTGINQGNESQANANSLTKLQSNAETTLQVDQEKNIAQRKLQELIDNSPGVKQLKAYQEMADNYKKHKAPLVTDMAVQQKKMPVIQRSIIAHGPIDGLAADMDTANKPASMAQIAAMWDGGKITGLQQLKTALGAVAAETNKMNNLALRFEIFSKLNKMRWFDTHAGVSSTAEREAFDRANPAGNETGIVNNPGVGEVLPAAPTARQTHSINVRSWQIGDIADGISWSQLGAHLQGRMDAAKYLELGNNILSLRDARNGTNLQATTPDDQKRAIATASLVRVTAEVRGGLDGLPKKEGVSYRAATSAAGVYGTTINVGDYIKDMSFWSTSGLKLSHLNVEFGAEGTVATPKVYYIITGSNGVFVPRFTNKETAVREVLYKNQTIFLVTKITNYANRTMFVYVTEKDPLQAPLNPATKDPWTGGNNP